MSLLDILSAFFMLALISTIVWVVCSLTVAPGHIVRVWRWIKDKITSSLPRALYTGWSKIRHERTDGRA